MSMAFSERKVDIVRYLPGALKIWFHSSNFECKVDSHVCICKSDVFQLGTEEHLI